MNVPSINDFRCPNSACRAAQIRWKGLPFERVEYVALDAQGKEIDRIIVYRCRHCGHEFRIGKA